jgi:hypothetical protein
MVKGDRVYYEHRGEKLSGTILSVQVRSSIGYTTARLTIKGDDGKTVSKLVGTQYADKVTKI